MQGSQKRSFLLPCTRLFDGDNDVFGILLSLFMIFTSASPAQAGNPDESAAKKPVLFEFETTEADATASLNRISGNIDLGFSAPGQTYKSASHFGAGPTSYEKSKTDL